MGGPLEVGQPGPQAGEAWGGRLPGSVADERLGEVPGEVIGTELRQGHHARPCLFYRGPWGDKRGGEAW